MKDAPIFYRNLEKEMDVRRKQGILSQTNSSLEAPVNMTSTDILNLSGSGALRNSFLAELARHPEFNISAHGSRLGGGNSKYLDDFERELADFHDSESALVFNTGALANGDIFSSIPLAGDVILYDELVHASIHEGMKRSLAEYKLPFRHNDIESFSNTLITIRNSHVQIRDGTRSVIVSLEGVYSMDGDICPLQELVNEAKKIFPGGNLPIHN